MFIIQSNQPNYCGHTFASPFCRTEYDGKAAKTGGLSRGLCRTGSTISQVSSSTICDYDATQVELNFNVTTKPQQLVLVRVQTPCGEIGTMEFKDFDTEQVFRPMQHGCGNGVWKIDVCQLIDSSETVLSTVSMPINGVGILYFAIKDSLHLSLIGKEFLHMSGVCRKHFS